MNTRVGCRCLLQMIVSTQESNPQYPALSGRFSTTDPPMRLPTHLSSIHLSIHISGYPLIHPHKWIISTYPNLLQSIHLTKSSINLPPHPTLCPPIAHPPVYPGAHWYQCTSLHLYPVTSPPLLAPPTTMGRSPPLCQSGPPQDRRRAGLHGGDDALHARVVQHAGPLLDGVLGPR